MFIPLLRESHDLPEVDHSAYMFIYLWNGFPQQVIIEDWNVIGYARDGIALVNAIFENVQQIMPVRINHLYTYSEFEAIFNRDPREHSNYTPINNTNAPVVVVIEEPTTSTQSVPEVTATKYHTTSAKINNQYPEVSQWLMDAGATIIDNGANAELLVKTMGYIKDTHVNTLMALRVQMITAFAVMSIGIIAANIHIIIR